MRLIKKKLDTLPLPQRQFKVDKHYEVKAEEIAYEDDTILACTIWYSLNDEPTCRVFITKDKYITRLYFSKDKGWGEAGINNYVCGAHYNWWSWNREKNKVYADEESIQIIRKYSKILNEDDCIHGIQYIQSRIREERIEKKEREEQARWDAVLDTTPEFPNNLNQWVKDVAMKDCRYILYETTRKKEKNGCCTYCGKYVKLVNVKHNQAGICPECKSKVVYKCGGKQKYIESGIKEVEIAQVTTAKKVVIRHVRYSQLITVKKWDEHYLKLTYWEMSRTFISSTYNKERYVWELYKGKRHRFCYEDNSFSYYNYNREYTYVEDKEKISEILNNGLKYLPDEIFKYACSIKRLIDNSERIGMVERLWKRGLRRCALDLTNSYSSYIHEKAIFKMAGIENDDLKILTKADASLKEFEHWKAFKKNGKKPSYEELLATREMNLSFERLAEFSKYASIKKVLGYIVGQQGTNVPSVYEDYLSLCKELRLNMKDDFVVFPKNLTEAHDNLVEIKNEKDNQKMKRKLDKEYAAITKMEKALNEKYAVKNKEYFIRAPHSAYEILLEGQKLHHCVGGQNYRDKMKEGKSFILFLRKASDPETPWYTIEVSNKNTILQYHGWCNRDLDKKDTMEIMKKFSRRLEKLKKEAEKQLAAV